LASIFSGHRSEAVVRGHRWPGLRQPRPTAEPPPGSGEAPQRPCSAVGSAGARVSAPPPAARPPPAACWRFAIVRAPPRARPPPYRPSALPEAAPGGASLVRPLFGPRRPASLASRRPPASSTRQASLGASISWPGTSDAEAPRRQPAFWPAWPALGAQCALPWPRDRALLLDRAGPLASPSTAPWISLRWSCSSPLALANRLAGPLFVLSRPARPGVCCSSSWACGSFGTWATTSSFCLEPHWQTERGKRSEPAPGGDRPVPPGRGFGGTFQSRPAAAWTGRIALLPRRHGEGGPTPGLPPERRRTI